MLYAAEMPFLFNKKLSSCWFQSDPRKLLPDLDRVFHPAEGWQKQGDRFPGLFCCQAGLRPGVRHHRALRITVGSLTPDNIHSFTQYKPIA